MTLNTRKLNYIHFFLFRKFLNSKSLYSNNIDYFYFKSGLVSAEHSNSTNKFIKFIDFLNLNSRGFIGKTLDWASVSSINELALSTFSRKQFMLDSQSKNYTSFAKFMFLSKNQLKNISKDCFFMFIGSALRIEEPLLNLILRKLSISRGGVFLNIGSRLSSNFYVKHIGSSVKTLLKFIMGNHWAVNLYFKSLQSFFLFGNSFFSSPKNSEILNEFMRRGFGLRKDDVVFFSGNVPTYLSSFILGLQSNNTEFINTKVNPFVIDLSFSSLQGKARHFEAEKNRLLISFDHNFNSVNRLAGDVIVPLRNFVEKKSSVFINSFYEVMKNNTSFIRDVEKLFSMSYKKSYDFLVYDSKILNFGLLRSSILNSKLDSSKNAVVKICQFAPLLFFSYEHLYNTADSLILRKLLVDGAIFLSPSFKNFFSFYLSNSSLFLPGPSKNKEVFINIVESKTLSFFDLNKFSLVTNKVYFDPENDVFSNSSVLLLKTYKRLVITMSNFN